MCIYYQELNKQMKLEHYTLLKIDNFLEIITYIYYLSNIYLKSGYH